MDYLKDIREELTNLESRVIQLQEDNKGHQNIVDILAGKKTMLCDKSIDDMIHIGNNIFLHKCQADSYKKSIMDNNKQIVKLEKQIEPLRDMIELHNAREKVKELEEKLGITAKNIEESLNITAEINERRDSTLENSKNNSFWEDVYNWILQMIGMSDKIKLKTASVAFAKDATGLSDSIVNLAQGNQENLQKEFAFTQTINSSIMKQN